MKEKYAYVTLCVNDIYLLPCLVMIKSWQKTNSNYDFYVIVTEHVSSTTTAILSQFGYKIINEKYYIPAINNTSSTDINQVGWHNIGTKLCIGKLEQFEKIIYIDADTVFLQNMDELFQKPHMTAVENYTEQFCGGLLVIKPNQQEFDDLMQFIEHFPKTQTVVTEESVLSHFFPEGSKNYELRLPYYGHKDLSIYSFQGGKNNGHKIKAIHFAGACKPWLFKDRKTTIETAMQRDNFITAFGFNVYYELLNECLTELEDKDISLMFKGFKY